MGRILVVDDQRNMRAMLVLMLRTGDHNPDEADSAEAAQLKLEQEHYDLVVTDLRMSGASGLDLLERVRRRSPAPEVIVMTGFGTVDTAVEAMKLGAYDYLQKPFSEEEFLIKVSRAIEKSKLASQVGMLTADFQEKFSANQILGRSAAIREIVQRIIRVGPTETTALITGESGTGKELVARAIHANSARASQPFVPVNCAAISEQMLESELFGHVKGAFTGAAAARRGLLEEASGGTFFFDEIAETPPSFQAKLLRAIQEREIRRLGDNKNIPVDVRIIAATSQDLAEAVQEKRFRQDLYYRLHVARFVLPALRERREDVPLLAQAFLARANHKLRRSIVFGDGVLEQLERYEFPGNIRELENLIEQASVMTPGDVLRVDDVLPARDSSAPKTGSTRANGGTLQAAVDITEHDVIERTLLDLQWNKEKAADQLGLSHTTLWRKMKRLNIPMQPATSQ